MNTHTFHLIWSTGTDSEGMTVTRDELRRAVTDNALSSKSLPQVRVPITRDFDDAMQVGQADLFVDTSGEYLIAAVPLACYARSEVAERIKNANIQYRPKFTVKGTSKISYVIEIAQTRNGMQIPSASPLRPYTYWIDLRAEKDSVDGVVQLSDPPVVHVSGSMQPLACYTTMNGRAMVLDAAEFMREFTQITP